MLCRPDGSALRRLLDWLWSASDPRRERYLRLLTVINGWPAPQSLAPVFDWSARALRARTPHQPRPSRMTSPDDHAERASGDQLGDAPPIGPLGQGPRFVARRVQCSGKLKV
ncbi:hypothetical protein [Kitasatospora sp. HPMI-4]|uniref:hypothetical protein n=1 Tax=Kitasatospora sp. HPMI-4 TaxID=3448443 RepID=UPI003F1D846D